MIHAGSSAVGESCPPAQDCRLQLDRILNSADFEATAREHRFLSHVVDETLAGRGGRIKAYSIAVEVFGRDASFDPQNDPIVRIEAGHLRRSLERYYFRAGQDDPILITIPKGGYVPTFSLRSDTKAVEEVVSPVVATGDAGLFSWQRPFRSRAILSAVVASLAVLAVGVLALGSTKTNVAPTSPETPRLLVSKFEDLSGTEASSALAIGLTQEVVGQLSKFRDIMVMESSPAPDNASALLPRFVLSGNVDLNPEAFRLRVKLTRNADGTVLWANSYDGGTKVADLLGAQADIARNVATSLAQTYGVIFQADASLDLENPSFDWAAYSCTLSFFAYRVELDPKTRSAVRACLESAVDRFEDYATAWGLLSLIYIDEYRFEFPDDPAAAEAPLARAFSAARRAVELDPLNIRGRQAEMFALYFSKEIDAALAVGKQALAINPNDTELMREYGDRLAVSGNWHDGCLLMEEALRRNPGSLGYYEATLALCSYFNGNLSQAATSIRKSPIASNPVYHVIAAAIYAEGGYELEAARERAWLETNQPEFVKDMRKHVSMRLARSEDVEFFLGSLRKAGLSFKD